MWTYIRTWTGVPLRSCSIDCCFAFVAWDDAAVVTEVYRRVEVLIDAYGKCFVISQRKQATCSRWRKFSWRSAISGNHLVWWDWCDRNGFARTSVEEAALEVFRGIRPAAIPEGTSLWTLDLTGAASLEAATFIPGRVFYAFLAKWAGRNASPWRRGSCTVPVFPCKLAHTTREKASVMVLGRRRCTFKTGEAPRHAVWFTYAARSVATL